MNIHTIPDENLLRQAAATLPPQFRPSLTPLAAVCEAALTADECDAIVVRFDQEEPYTFRACGARTREIEGHAPELELMERIARTVNDAWFGYQLDDHITSWMQTYQSGGDYRMHTDGVPGQTRKLTCVALLSCKAGYSGGELSIVTPDRTYAVPKTRGTLIVFPGWVWHEVSPVKTGVRQTVNMGFWGPPFT